MAMCSTEGFFVLVFVLELDIQRICKLFFIELGAFFRMQVPLDLQHRRGGARYGGPRALAIADVLVLLQGLCSPLNKPAVCTWCYRMEARLFLSTRAKNMIYDILIWGDM